MSKDSHFTGQPVYSQVLKLLDKEKILQISRETKGSEAYVKRFDGYQHLVVMLFGILKHFDSLRELEIGMKAEAHKLGHLGMNYLVRRSTLAEANIRRPQEFFASVYAYLLEKYAKFLADSRPSKCYKGQTHEPKDWEKLLYMMDSTTITLFDNILKGVGRHPKSGKKKGGMKVHTVMKYHVGVPMVVQLTSAAKHDHYLLKEVHLPKDSTLAMDRGYVDIAQFQRLTEEGVCYVTKMKKNLKYEELESITYVNPQGLVTHIDKKVLFTRGELTHEARRDKKYANGLDDSPVMRSDYVSPVKSIGHGITTMQDLENNAEVWCVMLELVQEIGTKLRAHKKKAGGIAISIRNNELYTKEWQCRIGIPTQSPTYLAKTAFALFAKNYQWEHPIRSVTVRAINLFEEDCPIQYDLFTDVKSLDRQERLDAAIEQIRFRFGKDAIKNGVLFQKSKMPTEQKVDLVMPTGMIG